MHNDFVCCTECFSEIAYQSTTAATLWVDLCCLMAKSELGRVKLPQRDWNELRLLEQMSYILTTEDLNSLYIRVEGLGVDNDGRYMFCVCEPEGDDSHEVY